MLREISLRVLKIIIILYILLSITKAYAQSTLTVDISFINETNKNVVQTKEPYLENYSHYLKGNYDFTPPDKLIVPHQSTQAHIAHEWYFGWYGASQFAYNYEGRSKDYGCFITEIRFSGRLYDWRNYNVIITSYVQDPVYPDDYLICTVEPSLSSSDEFVVHLQSSTQDKNTDDTQRFSIAGDTDYLKSTSYYGINLPIQLNSKLFLYPDNLQPELMRNDFSPPASWTDERRHDQKILVINHTDETLIAGTPILDLQNRFNSNYSVDQPQEILPNESKSITTSSSIPRPLQRFNYHIKDYAEDSGCYIAYIDHSFLCNPPNYVPIVSFIFDRNHPEPEKNLYCIMKDNATVDVYDRFISGVFKDCSEANSQDCISEGNNTFLATLNWWHRWESYDFFINPQRQVSVSSYSACSL